MTGSVAGWGTTGERLSETWRRKGKVQLHKEYFACDVWPKKKRKSVFLHVEAKPAIQYSPHLSLIVVDGQVLSVTFDRGEGAHGDAANGVGGEKLTQLLALVALETEPHVFKRSLL